MTMSWDIYFPMNFILPNKVKTESAVPHLEQMEHVSTEADPTHGCTST